MRAMATPVRWIVVLGLLALGLAACAPAATAPQPAPTSASPVARSASPVAAASPAASPNARPAASQVAAQPQPTAIPRSGSDRDVILATTTSTQDSGLLDVLVPLFEKQTGYQVKTVSVGTGAALALGARGEADVVLVHAPESEEAWMAQGNGTQRLLVMHNDFVIVGPKSDPGGLRGVRTAVDGLKRIADARATFVSRGDNSGTNQLEVALWKQAGIAPKGQGWYVESGTGMGQTLTISDQRDAYTVADRATWLAFKDRLAMDIVLERDPVLFNVYHVMPVNPAKFPNVKINTAGGKAFADFMVAADTQKVIGDFGKDRYGQALFVPDAGKDESSLRS